MRLFRFASQVKWKITRDNVTLNVVTKGVESAKMAEIYQRSLKPKRR